MITLKNGNEVEPGCWLDGWHGWTNSYRVVEIARHHGMELPAEDEVIVDWYRSSNDSDAGTSDAELDKLEAMTGQGGITDRATAYLDEQLPESWVLRWDDGLTCLPAWEDCAADGGGCDVDYRDGRDIVTPCADHRPEYVIRVELLLADGHWFSYGVGLWREGEPVDLLAHDSVTFETPGLDNLKTEGTHTHLSQIGAPKVREAAERLIEKHLENAR